MVQFLTKTIQLQEFAQMLGGATIEISKGISKTISAKTLATGQVAVGVQAVFSLGGSKHLQLVIQGQASETSTGGTVAVDQQYSFGLQWNF